MITPSFWTDDAIIELEIGARLLFIGMWNFSDDEGIIPNKPKQIKAQIYPADNINHEQINEWLMSIHEHGLILFNKDRSLIRIKGWLTYQKINRPTPSIYVFEQGDSMSNHELLMPKRSKEKLKEVKGTTNVQTDKTFEQFWILYPRKVQKARAYKSFTRLNKTEQDLALEYISKHNQHWLSSNRDKEHIPHATTWLNNKSWEDELETNSGSVSVVSEEELKKKKELHDKFKAAEESYKNGANNQHKKIYQNDVDSNSESSNLKYKDVLKQMEERSNDNTQ